MVAYDLLCDVWHIIDISEINHEVRALTNEILQDSLRHESWCMTYKKATLKKYKFQIKICQSLTQVCGAEWKASGVMEKCGSTGARTRVLRVSGVSRRPRGQGAPPLVGVNCCDYVLRSG